jgi:hypothetical protein
VCVCVCVRACVYVYMCVRVCCCPISGFGCNCLQATLQLMYVCTQLSPICSQATDLSTKPMHQTYAPNLCTKPVHQTCAPNLCTKPMHQTYEPNLCTKPMHSARLCAGLSDVYMRMKYLITLPIRAKQFTVTLEVNQNLYSNECGAEAQRLGADPCEGCAAKHTHSLSLSSFSLSFSFSLPLYLSISISLSHTDTHKMYTRIQTHVHEHCSCFTYAVCASIT